MKILSGILRNKKIFYNPSILIRPTKQRIKQAIFNVIRHRFFPDFQELNFLDCFAGTGAFGLEAISFGAKFVQFVEKDKNAANFLQKNIKNLNFQDGVLITCCDFLTFTSPCTFDVIFLDPPYATELIQKAIQNILENIKMKSETIFITECLKNDFCKINQQLQNLGIHLLSEKNYGKITIGFFRK
jgi:16S rRNA (guanine966-N2)-methyltransferase